MIKKLFVDFDNTLVNSTKRIVNLYHEDFHLYKNFKPIHWTDINTYEFKELTLADKNIIMDYFDDFRFFDTKLEFMDNAYEVLNELKDEYEVIVVTIGRHKNLKLKQEWIQKKLPFAKMIGIDINTYKDKSHIDMSGECTFFVDDVTEYLVGVNAKYRFTFGDEYPWNTPQLYPRAYNWTELKKYIRILEQ